MKPETHVNNRFRDAVRPVIPGILIEKTNNPYKGGILDLYVEHFRFVGWIETKHSKRKARAEQVLPTAAIVNKVSKLQEERFIMHLNNEIPCFLLCGFDGINAQNRTYAAIEPQLDGDNVWWPSQTTVLSKQGIVRFMTRWVRPYHE